MSFDRTNADDLLALKDEVENDPESAGYAAVVTVTAELLALLNLEENNPQVNDEVGIPFDDFPMVDVIDEIVQSEYNALSDFKKVKIDAVVYAGTCYPGLTFGHIKKVFKNAFGSTSDTWLAVKDDRMRHASRSETLFGLGTVISSQDWFAARDS